jgi:hypothetical protein
LKNKTYLKLAMLNKKQNTSNNKTTDSIEQPKPHNRAHKPATCFPTREDNSSGDKPRQQTCHPEKQTGGSAQQHAIHLGREPHPNGSLCQAAMGNHPNIIARRQRGQPNQTSNPTAGQQDPQTAGQSNLHAET